MDFDGEGKQGFYGRWFFNNMARDNLYWMPYMYLGLWFLNGFRAVNLNRLNFAEWDGEMLRDFYFFVMFSYPAMWITSTALFAVAWPVYLNEWITTNFM